MAPMKRNISPPLALLFCISNTSVSISNNSIARVYLVIIASSLGDIPGMSHVTHHTLEGLELASLASPALCA